MTASSAEVIRRYRDVLGLSREDVARMIDVSAAAVVKWETTSTTPERPNAAALDEALGAGGAILAACGYPAPVDWGTDLSMLREQLADLVQQFQSLTAVVEHLRRRSQDD